MCRKPFLSTGSDSKDKLSRDNQCETAGWPTLFLRQLESLKDIPMVAVISSGYCETMEGCHQLHEAIVMSVPLLHEQCYSMSQQLL